MNKLRKWFRGTHACSRCWDSGIQPSEICPATSPGFIYWLTIVRSSRGWQAGTPWVAEPLPGLKIGFTGSICGRPRDATPPGHCRTARCNPLYLRIDKPEAIPRECLPLGQRECSVANADEQQETSHRAASTRTE